MGIHVAMKTKQEHSHVLEKKSSGLGGLLTFLTCFVGDCSSHVGVVLNEELFKRKATESKVENQVGNWM